MIVNLYRNKTPISVSTLPILVIVGCLSIIFNESNTTQSVFLWQTAFVNLITKNSWVNYFATVAILSINAHQLNRVFNANTFFSRDTTLPGLIYLLGIFSFDACYFSFELIIHTAMIGAMAALFMINRQISSKSLIFFASLCLGIAFIFEGFALGFLLIPLFTLVILKPVIWREYLIALIGFVLPTLYHIFFIFLTDAEIPERLFYISLHEPYVAWTTIEMVTYISFLLLFIISFIRYFGVMRSQVVNFKKLSQILFLVLFVSVSVSVLQIIFFDSITLSFLLPAGIIITTHFLYHERAILSEVLVLIWFCGAMINLFS